MEKKIKKIFFKITGRDTSDISAKTKLKKLGLTSLALVEIVCAIEEEFDIEIPNSAIKKFKTVNDVINFIDKNTDK